MKIATDKVIGGRIVMDGLTLNEGEEVTELARETEEAVMLTPEEEAELLESMAEADRGETISAEELLAKLARRRG